MNEKQRKYQGFGREIGMKPNCTNCLYCKLTDKWTRLKCSEGHWVNADLNDKFVRLNERELKTLEISQRDIFRQAIKCFDWCDNSPIGQKASDGPLSPKLQGQYRKCRPSANIDG